ncbi:hypothetical protein BVG16_28980 [Paenibacillus selenitireducens]|uniref:DNA-binding response regulator n=1 Tax=Paenibacillus selenitireducens TaxID=1324314 RepID=A0A1T2X0D9_9BACL|nr:response regulator [Paenibacillus selenitireducens]OPA73369.1 hypothetical protein BVG16_28980 [Paenibacillus selenitireducens]
MYKLLLVDDEPWILKDMEQIIDWEEAGFQIVASVNDVQIAESILRRRQIDVVISDIRMPGKSGLELLTFVNRVTPHTLVVFMSAYSEFAYAKQAIENGCFNYMLKPVNVDELLETLDRCAERLSARVQEQSLRQAYEYSMMLVEWVESDVSVRRVQEQLVRTGATFPAESHYAFATVKRKEMLSEAELSILDRLLEQYGVTIFRGRVSSFKWTYLLGFPVLGDFSARKLYREVKQHAARQGWDIGISSIGSPEDRAGRLYHQASMMADTSSLNRPVGMYRYNKHINSAVPILREQINKATRIEHLEAALFGIGKGIANGRIHLSGLVELYNLLTQSLIQLSTFGTEVPESITVQDLLLHYGTPHDLLEELTMRIEEHKRKPSDINAIPIVEGITKDLDRMYAHRVSLKEMAQKYFISPNYLSHLFKQEKGTSFINYLIQKRLEAAIDLLKKDISLYEVGRLVGYDDYAHFSKLFKKHIGMSPLDYRQQHKP